MASRTLYLKIDQVFDQFEGKLKYSILIPNYVIGQKRLNNVIQLYSDVGLFTYVKKQMVSGHPFWTLLKAKSFSKLMMSLSEYSPGSNKNYQIKNLIAIHKGRLLTLVENKQLKLLLHQIDEETCSSILFVSLKEIYEIESHFRLIKCLDNAMTFNRIST